MLWVRDSSKYTQHTFFCEDQTVENNSLSCCQIPTLSSFRKLCRLSRCPYIEKPENYWSCIAHLSAEDILKSAVIEEKTFKHSPWEGADNPLVPKFLCQQEGLITMFICCKFKKNLFNLWLYTHFFHNLITTGQGQTTPREKFWCQQKPLVTSVICFKFKKIYIFEVWFYLFILFFVLFYLFIYLFYFILFILFFLFFFFFTILYLYIARGRGWQPLGDELFISTGTSCHFGHLLQVLKKSLKSDFIQLFSWFYSCI